MDIQIYLYDVRLKGFLHIHIPRRNLRWTDLTNDTTLHIFTFSPNETRLLPLR